MRVRHREDNSDADSPDMSDRAHPLASLEHSCIATDYSEPLLQAHRHETVIAPRSSSRYDVEAISRRSSAEAALHVRDQHRESALQTHRVVASRSEPAHMDSMHPAPRAHQCGSREQNSSRDQAADDRMFSHPSPDAAYTVDQLGAQCIRHLRLLPDGWPLLPTLCRRFIDDLVHRACHGAIGRLRIAAEAGSCVHVDHHVVSELT